LDSYTGTPDENNEAIQGLNGAKVKVQNVKDQGLKAVEIISQLPFSFLEEVCGRWPFDYTQDRFQGRRGSNRRGVPQDLTEGSA